MPKLKRKKYKFDKKQFITLIAFSFLCTSIYILIFYFVLNDKVSNYTNLINTIAIKTNNEEKEVSFDSVKKKLKTYPTYGSKYAKIKIEKINLELPVYYGDNLEILSQGIGQYAGSYFPGENGTTLLAGHNIKYYLGRITKLEKGDKIEIEATYGTFNYVVDDYKIVKETDLDAFEIKSDEPSLILYTCYPFTYGRKTERYVVYAKGDNNG